MNEIYKWLSYKKNRTKFVHVTCFAIGVAILLGLFGDGLHPKIGWMSDDKPVNEFSSYLSYTFSEMQAEPRQIRGDSRNYDLCINSSSPGVDGVVDIIELLVKRELSSREALL